jgi:uncharacterized peroxidase-related enzyme
MSRIAIPQEIPADSKAVVDAVSKQLKLTPNLFRVMAQSPFALNGWAGLQASLAKTLDVKTRDGIALAVSQVNGCQYCLSAHAYVASRLVGVSDEEIALNRQGRSESPRIAAAVAFAQAVMQTRGKVADSDLDAVRAAGYSDAEHRRDHRAECAVHVDKFRQQRLRYRYRFSGRRSGNRLSARPWTTFSESIMTRTVSQKRAAFRALHASGCFVLPNPWDVGSARYLASLGFEAIATTSSGFAWSVGRADNHIERDMILEHLRAMVDATDLPVNADFENGFGANPTAVAQSVGLAIETGVAGLSIEDSTGDPSAPLFTLDEAVARLEAARRAIDERGEETVLIGRAENFFVGVPNLDDTVGRLQAYAAAGADCLYAPGIQTREQIEAVVAAVAPKPVNVLIGGTSAFTLHDLAELGVRRVSVGGGLARAAWGGLMRAAQDLADGRFDGFEGAAPGAQLNALFLGHA